jgi:hypothetical protein
MRTERSREMIRASYFMARFGELGDTGNCKPPAEMGVDKWPEAYDKLHRQLGDGRPFKTFRNSIRNEQKHQRECLDGQNTLSEKRRAILGDFVRLGRAEMWDEVRQYVE